MNSGTSAKAWFFTGHYHLAVVSGAGASLPLQDRACAFPRATATASVGGGSTRDPAAGG